MFKSTFNFRISIVTFFIVLAIPFLSFGDTPKLGQERVILHTNVGDIMVALFPEVAPQHVEQFIKLVQSGVYDNTPFHRLEKGFVLQLDSYERRNEPLSETQAAVVKKLPAEFNQIRHRAGILSMARYDESNDSAETSFSFLLGDAPHLDGQYTVFGVVVKGMDVLRNIEKLQVDSQFRPTQNIFVEKAEVSDAVSAYSIQLKGPTAVNNSEQIYRKFFLIFAVLAFTGITCASIYGALTSNKV